MCIRVRGWCMWHFTEALKKISWGICQSKLRHLRPMSTKVSLLCKYIYLRWFYITLFLCRKKQQQQNKANMFKTKVAEHEQGRNETQTERSSWRQWAIIIIISVPVSITEAENTQGRLMGVVIERTEQNDEKRAHTVYTMHIAYIYIHKHKDVLQRRRRLS